MNQLLVHLWARREMNALGAISTIYALAPPDERKLVAEKGNMKQEVK
jgi:hypothetical protein